MMEKFKLIIASEDGRQIERLFDSMEELEAFKEERIKASGAKMKKTASYPESPGVPSVDIYEEEKP